MVYNVFYKTSSGANTSGGAVNKDIMSGRELSEELCKPIIRIFEKWKVYSFNRNSIWIAY